MNNILMIFMHWQVSSIFIVMSTILAHVTKYLVFAQVTKYTLHSIEYKHHTIEFIILVSKFEIANKVQTLAKFRSRDISKVHHISRVCRHITKSISII